MAEVFSVLHAHTIADADKGHAMTLSMRRVYANTAILVLNFVICVIVLELGAAALLAVSGALRPVEPLDKRSQSSYYASQEWAPTYWREFSDSRHQMYQPFLLWNRRGFSGQTINVGDDGVRATPGAACAPGAFTVFIFGGSTVWGTGSPDWGTLPAYVQKGLQRTKAGPVCVVNYGESAYVSTQSVMRLMFQLRAGHVPDLVIFYEGPNDVYSAYQSGRTGTHENLDQFVTVLERSEESALDRMASLLRQSRLFALTSAVVARATHVDERDQKLLTYRTMGVDEKTLAAGVADVFLGNYRLADALSKQYGFEMRSYWPPYITLSGKPLEEEERALVDEVDPDLRRLYHLSYHAVMARAAGYPKLVDATSVFDDYHGLLWLDDIHVTPVGNQLLARWIVGETLHHHGGGKPPE